MLEAFIITLREGVEAALIVGITLAYLAKINRPELRKSVYAALGAAFVGSIGVAIIIARTHFNQDIFEGCGILVAVACPEVGEGVVACMPGIAMTVARTVVMYGLSKALGVAVEVLAELLSNVGGGARASAGTAWTAEQVGHQDHARVGAIAP